MFLFLSGVCAIASPRALTNLMLIGPNYTSLFSDQSEHQSLIGASRKKTHMSTTSLKGICFYSAASKGRYIHCNVYLTGTVCSGHAKHPIVSVGRGRELAVQLAVYSMPYWR